MTNTLWLFDDYRKNSFCLSWNHPTMIWDLMMIQSERSYCMIMSFTWQKKHHGPGKIKNTTYCIHLYATCILQFQTWFTHIVFRYLMICSYCRKVLTFTSNHISPVRQLFTCPLAIQQSLMEDHHFLNTQIIQPNGPWRPWLPARLVVRNYQDQ